MRRLLSAVLLALPLLAGSWAGATTIPAGDYGGGPLSPANGDVLSGTYVNVSSFTLQPGTTVFVEPDTTLAIYASTIAIYGTLDGSGRGSPGGNGGGTASAGLAGFSADSGGLGGGGAGAGGTSSTAGLGGGGGGHAGSGGNGAGASAGAGGASYSTSISVPLSADDAIEGSGGGGGGGGQNAQNGSGGSGSAGGGAIYLEGSSVTVSGTISVNGSTAAAVTDTAGSGNHPGGGGGGAAGSIVLRVTGSLTFKATTRLSASGGKGGDVDTLFPPAALEPGGGGSGGIVRIAAAAADYSGAVISTAPGSAGIKPSGFTGTVDTTNPPTVGAAGSVTFSTVAVSPTHFIAQSVYVSSINWSWDPTASFGDGPSTAAYRLFGSTIAPLSNPELVTSIVGSTETGLSPNTTYFRVVTAYTDWGDSLPSMSVTTHTLANVPGGAAAAFSAMGDVTATFNWTANSPANPGYTVYEVDRSTDTNFGLAVSTGFVVGLSSAPAGLLPNTTYYWRVRAVNIDGIPSDYAAKVATATLATAPSAAAFGTVFVTSVSFTWARGSNPADTVYEAQVSTDNFFTLSAASDTLAGSATFFSLTPGTQYFFRAFALNRESVASAFSAVISTRSGNLSDVTAPTAPGQPFADRQFSYDGTATFSWSPSASSVGILDYHLIIGSTPGGNDVVDVSTGVPVYLASGLTTGRSYYARVAARSNAGVVSQFSAISAGLPVFIPAQSNPLEKAINWPNPFDPNTGPTQIGFVLDSPADVELKIFTLQGHLAHSQSFSFGAAGNQIVTWDGHNDSGGKVAPGGYIGLILKKYPGHTDSQKLKIAVVY